MSRINALSFHSIDTQSQSATPNVERIKSGCSKPGTPRIEIADKTNTDATHFTYQSSVYLGVADLNILLEFASSSLEISLGFFSFNIFVYLFPISNYSNSIITGVI